MHVGHWPAVIHLAIFRARCTPVAHSEPLHDDGPHSHVLTGLLAKSCAVIVGRAKVWLVRHLWNGLPARVSEASRPPPPTCHATLPSRMFTATTTTNSTRVVTCSHCTNVNGGGTVKIGEICSIVDNRPGCWIQKPGYNHLHRCHLDNWDDCHPEEQGTTQLLRLKVSGAGFQDTNGIYTETPGVVQGVSLSPCKFALRCPACSGFAHLCSHPAPCPVEIASSCA